MNPSIFWQGLIMVTISVFLLPIGTIAQNYTNYYPDAPAGGTFGVPWEQPETRENVVLPFDYNASTLYPAGRTVVFRSALGALGYKDLLVGLLDPDGVEIPNNIGHTPMYNLDIGAVGAYNNLIPTVCAYNETINTYLVGGYLLSGPTGNSEIWYMCLDQDLNPISFELLNDGSQDLFITDVCAVSGSSIGSDFALVGKSFAAGGYVDLKDALDNSTMSSATIVAEISAAGGPVLSWADINATVMGQSFSNFYPASIIEINNTTNTTNNGFFVSGTIYSSSLTAARPLVYLRTAYDLQSNSSDYNLTVAGFSSASMTWQFNAMEANYDEQSDQIDICGTISRLASSPIYHSGFFFDRILNVSNTPPTNPIASWSLSGPPLDFITRNFGQQATYYTRANKILDNVNSTVATEKVIIGEIMQTNSAGIDYTTPIIFNVNFAQVPSWVLNTTNATIYPRTMNTTSGAHSHQELGFDQKLNGFNQSIRWINPSPSMEIYNMGTLGTMNTPFGLREQFSLIATDGSSAYANTCNNATLNMRHHQVSITSLPTTNPPANSTPAMNVTMGSDPITATLMENTPCLAVQFKNNPNEIGENTSVIDFKLWSSNSALHWSGNIDNVKNINIYDLKGSKLLNIENSRFQEYTYDISTFAEGIYIAEVNFGDNSSLKIKIVK